MSNMEKNSPPTTNGWKKTLFVLKLLEVRLRFVAVLLITALLVGYWDKVQNYYERWTRSAPSEERSAASEFEYFCAMHPFVVRNTPGKCPVCGMDLTQRKHGDTSALPNGVLARVQTSPERIAQAGVEVVPVKYRLLTNEILSYGIVDHDETRVNRVNARFPGRIEEVLVNEIGLVVEKGDPLVRVYSPKFIAASNEYLQALDYRKKTEADPSASSESKELAVQLAESARKPLLLAGFTEEQLDALIKEGHAPSIMTLYAPSRGIVLERNVIKGEMVDEGAVLYTLADHSTLWVQAQILESDLGGVQRGMGAEITSVAYPGEKFYGQVDLIYPTFNSENRSIKTRIIISNEHAKLRPGMSVSVALRKPLGKITDAPGMSEPVMPMPVSKQETCPVSGEKWGTMGQPFSLEYKGQKLQLCCKNCLEDFNKDPEKYVAKLAREMPKKQEAPYPLKTCPVTGAELGSMGTPIEYHYQGRLIKFCCPDCPPKFEKSPAKYLAILDLASDTPWVEGFACPMHPDQLRPEGGKCTICPCGMETKRLRVEKQLSIPENSVIDTGRRKIVYVEAQSGVLEAHAVVLGKRSGEFYPVLSGLKPGDKVVARGAFLIDAEARLAGAPVTGADEKMPMMNAETGK